MKIAEIRALALHGATPKGGWSHELELDDCVHTLIEVCTDEGVTGLGSVFTSAALVEASLRVLRPLCVGESAIEPERVSEKLHQHTFWQGRGGAITHTISGIDIALWDIFGQVTGQPISRLIGGRYKERIKPYASLLMTEPAALAERLVEVKAQGFRAFKIGWGPFGRQDTKLDEDIVRAAREAIGPQCELMVDAGGSDAYWRGDLKWALRTADMLADYDVTWFEEALTPDDLTGYIELRRRSPVPISGGEVLTRRQSFQPWLSQGALDIVQPDVTKVGGISEERRIAWMAAEHNILFVPHGWNTAIGLAADLQLVSAFARTRWVEYITGSPYIDELVLEPWHLDDEGMLAIPDGPGLGIHLDPDAVERYSGQRLKGA
ncbi:MAG: mandelate racemase/muconate lactonizing enzyme family protein [Chloroflexi bacterium]|nr:mandelate racemase/muconate lactonizing enzyme family protein [Chloroflexota bacterium]